MVNKILFITLSNIGDCILTLPVLDNLRENFPQAKITVLAGPRTKEIFQDNPNIDGLIIFDKRSRLKEKIKLFRMLKREWFDMAVDLRNSFLGTFLPAKNKISPFLIIPKNIRHTKEKHLYKAKSIKSPAQRDPALYQNAGREKVKSQTVNLSLYIRPEDEEYIKNILRENSITGQDKIIVVAPGARSHAKRWAQDKFVDLIKALIKEFGAKIILAGDKDDAPINKYIAGHSGYPVLDLSAKTSIGQLACLLKKSKLVITNDSATLHLASYLNIPVVAIFGPTDEIKYGPWSQVYSIVKKDIYCRPCEEAQCRFGTLKCMQLIKVEDTLKQVRKLLVANHESRITNYEYKRILIVRTDRIGDVLLSTPVIKALRDNYPFAYIAMMVSPYGKNIIEGNPYLDEVIIYDKDGKHRTWPRSIKFSQNLKKKKFELAVVLHPTNRVHLVTFFAGIRRRIGYDRKSGFLLTDRIKHTKHLGQKHELEYALDLIRHLGIEPKDKTLFMPIKPESEEWAEEFLKQEGVKSSDRLLAIHPAASCPSKIWPNERFASVADKLIERYGFKVLVIAGPGDLVLAQSLIRHMHHPAINLSGKTSVSQLASLLKRCKLFISNDSGPVHIASAVGTPVISIFGRNQEGLSPTRWGPIGKKDMALRKEVGCIECLAHNCTKKFACLSAITVDDVTSAAESVLKNG